MHSWGTFPILYVCQHSAVLPYISLMSLSIGSYLELAIFREDFSSVVSVNVRFSWVFYFVFICSGYKLNSPHYSMGGMPRPVFIRGFPTFWSHDFRHGSVHVESSEGGRGRLYWSDSLPSSLKNFWKFLVFFFFVLSVSCWNIRFGAVCHFRLINSSSSTENLRIVFTYFIKFKSSRSFSRLHLVDFWKEVLRFP